MEEEDCVLPTQPQDYVMLYAIVRETLPHAQPSTAQTWYHTQLRLDREAIHGDVDSALVVSQSSHFLHFVRMEILVE